MHAKEVCLKGVPAPPLAGSVIGSATDNFVIAEWQDPGGPPGPPRYIAPLHLHRNDDEAWYVLEGTLCVQNGDQVIEARAGSAVLVKRGTPHTYWNPGPSGLRYLLIMTANTYALIQAIHGLKERTPEAMRNLFAQHDSELLS
jgi:mannose-6-phosphate isomerase-like protein (cupin superfamily)